MSTWNVIDDKIFGKRPLAAANRVLDKAPGRSSSRVLGGRQHTACLSLQGLIPKNTRNSLHNILMPMAAAFENSGVGMSSLTYAWRLP